VNEIDRITLLGLSPQEAKAWYNRNVLPSMLRRGSAAIAIGSLLVVATYTPVEGLLEATLVAHMIVQHFIFILAGFLCGYGTTIMLLVASRLSRGVLRMVVIVQRANSIYNKRGIAAFAISPLLIAYWYIPTNFDAAVLTASVRSEMHLTFLLVGALLFIGSTSLTKRIRQIAPIVAGKAMGLYGMFLILTPFNFYPVYPIAQQSDAGVVFLTIMLVMDFTIVPVWLYNYFGKCYGIPMSS
jgi:cytochrome c oxidase assembly factor CtaG